MYDFDTAYNRASSDSLKWANLESVCGAADALPLWVADMDFACPPAVVEAVRARAAHPLYGYPASEDGTRQALTSWMRRRHGWMIDPEWIVKTPGVVPGLNFAVRACTDPGDGVIIQPPVYRPFSASVDHADRTLIENSLVIENGTYSMDFEGLASLTPRHRSGATAKALIFSSPHNPVGRVWSRDELLRFLEVCASLNLIVISDEIHSDLVLGTTPHTPFASLSEDAARRSITLVAPNKTFNIAGLTAGCAIIPDPALRKRFSAQVAGVGIEVSNIFGNVAFVAAYEKGEAWLGQLLDYLKGNLAFLEDFIAAKLPELSMNRVEGTYLAWIDCRKLGLSAAALPEFFRKKARVWLDEGTKFGSGGAGFMRLNFACPRATLASALGRIESAIASDFRLG